MSKTLLLADDSVTIQKVVGISFANEDVVLLTVDNGDDAIARAREARPDLVLADVVMPGKSGYEVCEAIKSEASLQHVPVLLLTGTFEPFDEERAKRVGANGHITKPFEAQALVDQVNALLARAAAAPATEATPETASAPETPQAYDFFGDEAPRAARAPAPVATAEPLELDEAPEPLELEAAVEEDFGAGPVTETQVAMPAVAMQAQPERDPLGESDFTTMGLEPALDSTPTEAPRAPAPSAPPPPPQASPPQPAAWNDVTGGGPFDLDFMGTPARAASQPTPGDDPLAGIESEGLGGQAQLDPEAARAHEVSSSDLGGGFASPPPAPEQPSAPPPPPAFDEVPLAEPAPFGASAPGPEPSEPQAPIAYAAPVEPPPPVAYAAPVEPPAPVATPAPEVDEAAHLGPAPGAIGPTAASAPTPAPTAAPTLSPELRERVHESIEKVAWESFGDLSERIVRDVVERIEAVAWEVIPQMAESLIREEIQRLKAEDTEAS